MYVYPYGDSQQLNLDWIIKKLIELEQSWEAGEAAQLEEIANALISLTYNTNTLYARYDYAFYNGKLYRCLSGTSGAFDPDAWQEALIGDDLAILTRWINALNAAAVVDVKFDTSGTNGKIQQKYNDTYHDVVEVDYTPVQNSKRPLSSNAGYALNGAIDLEAQHFISTPFNWRTYPTVKDAVAAKLSTAFPDNGTYVFQCIVNASDPYQCRLDRTSTNLTLTYRKYNETDVQAYSSNGGSTWSDFPSVTDLNNALNSLCLKGAKTTINQAGTYSNISCTGLTANHKVCNWGLFSDSNLSTPIDENNPPADITITEGNGIYSITIANYSSAFYIQPTFILAQN